MNAFFALVRKDLTLFFSNRRSLLMAIVAPIAISAFFGGLFGPSGADRPAHVPIGVTDLDRSDASRRLVAALQADGSLAVTEADEASNAAAVKEGKLRAAVSLPAGFGTQAARALFGGRAAKPELVVTYDPSQQMALAMIRGLLAQHTMETIGASVFSGATPVLADLKQQALSAPGLPAARRDELIAMFDSIEKVAGAGAGVDTALRSGAEPARASSSPSPATSSAGSPSAAPRGLAMPFSLREVEAGARPEVRYNSYAHSFAGMGVQFILLMGVDLGIGLLTMRRLGLWKRLRAAPLSRTRLLGSRVASTALIALVVFGIVWTAAILGFGVRIEGSALGFVAVLIAFALLTASFGLLIAAIGKTPEATRGLAVLATLLLVMLGGAWVPSFLFPVWLQQASLAVPTRWAVDGLDAMTWRGLGLDAAALPVVVMLAFAAAFTALAVWRFRWEE